MTAVFEHYELGVGDAPGDAPGLLGGAEQVVAADDQRRSALGFGAAGPLRSRFARWYERTARAPHRRHRSTDDVAAGLIESLTRPDQREIVLPRGLVVRDSTAAPTLS